ncbi:uroporphyrinogen-III C-methyltransferase [Staphylococcus felis]|uniref:uroporphyrinogen-III C-methyltransferase n=1 Tax=Staphylococcus felis TaxID=46127 RepID=UPI000E2295E7|nr:uroporphyrinogen-III C-methyltransferase [Staphylococcus felis]REH95299.1 uroporphyrinogen-III C-methyltransferase [Staphylococcus felis]REI30168.1 uroporphyrinogen-III C-methyltransferase [Staphylococcus felis]UXR87208.1 uroporphyrinogen-III C-methyltransferase [Staphylococcus felis]
MSLIEKAKVYLVGAGPGNPLYLTRKAERCIQKADVILYDQLVNPFILQLSKPSAEWIHVGKTPYTKYIKQERINALLVEKANEYQTVVRLKGGDPAIFGRVAEEVETLKAHDIHFEIVPGVTAASAAVSQLERGLTERNVSTNITFTTGHFKNNEDNEIDITTLTHNGTLAIYMGIKRLPQLMQQIKSHIQKDFPVAVVFNASCHNQYIVTGTVTTIVDRIAQLPERLGPGITIVGDVAREIQSDTVLPLQSPDIILLQGPKDACLSLAYDLYEQGQVAYLDYQNDNTIHHTQRQKITELIQQTRITEIIKL